MKMYLVPPWCQALCQMPSYITGRIDRIYLAFTGKIKSGKLQARVEKMDLKPSGHHMAKNS